MKDESTLLIKYSKIFDKQRKSAPLEIKTAFREARELFRDNPSHPSLRNHALREQFAGYRSVDVTDDWRALFKTKKSKKQTVITFYVLGTHTKLYRKPKL